MPLSPGYGKKRRSYRYSWTRDEGQRKSWLIAPGKPDRKPIGPYPYVLGPQHRRLVST